MRRNRLRNSLSMQNLTTKQLVFLREIGDSPFSLVALRSLFPVKEVWRVAARLVENGLLIRLKRDLFVLSPDLLGRPIDRLLVANRLCSPSYVSREAALAHYGLIPELVVNVTSSRLGRSVMFDTPIGGFHYAQVDAATYAIGLREEASATSRFLCASPEKALYDLVVFRSQLNIRSRIEMQRFLFGDLRIDVSDRHFDGRIFDDLVSCGRKRRSIRIMKEVLCHGAI